MFTVVSRYDLDLVQYDSIYTCLAAPKLIGQLKTFKVIIQVDNLVD